MEEHLKAGLVSQYLLHFCFKLLQKQNNNKEKLLKPLDLLGTLKVADTLAPKKMSFIFQMLFFGLDLRFKVTFSDYLNT